MIVACSRLLIVLIFGDLVLSYFRVLRQMAGGYAIQNQNLSSGQHAPHPVRHVHPGTVPSHSVGITFLIGISHRKSVGYFAILEIRFVSSRMHLVMLNFSFEFHTVLWGFDKQFFYVNVPVPKDVC